MIQQKDMDGSGPNGIRRNHRIAVVDRAIAVDTTILRTRALPCRSNGRVPHLLPNAEGIAL